MIKNNAPRVTVSDSPLTESPQTGPSATMDDSLYTMDDSRIMMGGLVTITSNIRVKSTKLTPQASIRKRR